MAGNTQLEMIELQSLDGREEIDLTQGTRRPSRLERANAVRITPGKVPELLSKVRQLRLLGTQSDPRLTAEQGEGHRFQPCTHTQQTWCDLCGDFIWGIYKKSLRCIP